MIVVISFFPLYLLWWAGQRGAFTPQGVPLTDREQRAGQDGAEVVEGPPLGSIGLIGRGQDRSHRSREEPGEQGFFCVAVSSKSSGYTQEGGDNGPAQVFYTGKWKI